MMKLLITADLHLDKSWRSPRSGRTVLEELTRTVAAERPDVVVVAGDIGVATRAHQHLVELRLAVGDLPLALTLGNHDFWLNSLGHAQFTGLQQVMTRYWREPAAQIGATLLDRENLLLGDIALVGCYGHYDLGHAIPGLVVDGIEVSEDIYLSGGMNGLFWNDFRAIPNCATRLHDEAREQAEGLTLRMDAAIQERLRMVVVTHTCPWRKLNGHPRRSDAMDILSAYSGNSKIGRELGTRASWIDFHCCGHTHMPVAETSCEGIRCLNIGADYGVFRAVIYCTAIKSITWCGEPWSPESS